ncbi:NB-ARC domain-containing protein [Candidatus Electronema sp. TJ]|uniref:NB-ARC domain-containing protein n=1 Tax=Candidatus Electronema sp. TJ TaxID=3401573 RepID=UPI003AA8C47B
MTDIKQDSGGSSNNLIAVSNSEHVSITIQPSSASPPPPLSGKFDLSRLPKTDSALFGRDDELALIDQAWQEDGCNVLVLTAMGGAGKTALMQKWIDDEHWRGADAVYTWSFYSQGSSEDKQASAAEFFDNALAWFGHDGSPIRSEHDRGVKLAELVRRQRTLLVLDGLEPLQHPLGGPMNGALKDKGLLSLCLQLAADNNGLLLISSRQPVMELNGRPHQQQHELEPLNAAAGIALFRAAGIIGTDKELCAAVEAYNGHALSLSLLAKYLSEYENGDIRRQDMLRELTEFPEATRDSLHAFKMMAAYERQLFGSSDLQILFCLGLFDRPAAAEVMSFLRKEGLVGLPNDERVFRAACARLRKQSLLNTDRPEQPQNLDTHPLVRQYFGKRLSELHPESWRQAHVRLYEHFKAAAKELPDTLEEMEPLFAAVRHGCAAGMHNEAVHEVYWPRILRQNEHYLPKKIGAFAADLAVLAHFFAVPWHTPATGLTDHRKAVVLNWAAFRLSALGRLTEAAEPMQAGRDLSIDQEDWKGAAADASNLSELYLTVGDLAQAVVAGRQSVAFADRSGDAFDRMSGRITLADALHQAGELAEAHALFAEAEKMQQERQPEYDRLYSVQGFQYCDLLLAGGAWLEVRGRTEQWLQWRTQGDSLLSQALEYLTLGRAAVQEAIAQAGLPVISGVAPDLACVQPISGYVEPIDGAVERIGGCVERIDGAVERIGGYAEPIRRAVEWLNQAVDGLREAGTEHNLPWGLLARAACRRWAAHFSAAERDLRDCEEIAQRGGMQLHLIDCHLEAARLALASGKAVLGLTAEEHLAAAEDGITKTGYKRRLVEVEQIAAMVQPQGRGVIP